MPRGKTKSTDSQDVLLTEKEVFDVIKFAQSIYSGYPNVYTPELVNSRLKDVTMSPQAATAEKINSALQNPKENEQNLVGYSEFLELTSMLYKRMLLYFSGMMAFDWTYTCLNADELDPDSKTFVRDIKQYEKDLKIVLS